MTSAKPIYNAIVLLYPGTDILDYSGPIEVLSSALHDGDRKSAKPVFDIQTVARDDLPDVPTGRSPFGTDYLTIRPAKPISQALDEIEKVDILVVPGAPLEIVQAFALGGESEQGPEIGLIKAFMGAGPGPRLGKERGKEKVLLSVCTGAILLASVGALDGVESTTHHYAYDLLEKASGGKTKVVRGRRFVDAGPDNLAVKKGLRVITSGGVSSGIDSSLYLVEYLTGPEVADYVADVMEYDRRKT